MGRPYFRPAHRDASEPSIIDALRKAGASVWPISGEDVPDLLVGYKGQTWLLECKTRGREYTDKRNGKTYKRDGKLSTGQREFQDSWRGGPVRTVYTPEEALYAIGVPVEGVLGPLEKRCVCGHERGLHSSAVSVCRSESACPCERFAPERIHVVTPAFQREQTAAVVPKKRQK